MSTCLGKSCSFGLLCVSFVTVYKFVCMLLSLFASEGGALDLIVLIPGHYLSVYFPKLSCKSRWENPQKLTQFSPRSHQRYLVGKRQHKKTPSKTSPARAW